LTKNSEIRLRVSAAVRQSLERLAADSGTTLSGVARQALERFLEYNLPDARGRERHVVEAELTGSDYERFQQFFKYLRSEPPVKLAGQWIGQALKRNLGSFVLVDTWLRAFPELRNRPNARHLFRDWLRDRHRG
jgi:hypothetical protein